MAGPQTVCEVVYPEIVRVAGSISTFVSPESLFEPEASPASSRFVPCRVFELADGGAERGAELRFHPVFEAHLVVAGRAFLVAVFEFEVEGVRCSSRARSLGAPSPVTVPV